jgi:hypothetical protein
VSSPSSPQSPCASSPRGASIRHEPFRLVDNQNRQPNGGALSVHRPCTHQRLGGENLHAEEPRHASTISRPSIRSRFCGVSTNRTIPIDIRKRSRSTRCDPARFARCRFSLRRAPDTILTLGAPRIARAN